MPSAVNPLSNERANAIGPREAANDPDLELRDLTVEGEPLMRHWFEHNGERRTGVAPAA
jgi:hypothetical protein